MKHTLLNLALALVSPFAFAQTSPTDGETENPITPTTEAATITDSSNGETENIVTPKTEAATTTTDGTVSSFTPDEMISVQTAGDEWMSFAIGAGAKYQDKSGNDVDASTIKEGSTVQVTAEKNGDQMIASRIVVDS